MTADMQQDLQHLREIAAVLTRQIAPEDRVRHARAFMGRVLVTYWNQTAPPRDGLEVPFQAIPLGAVAEAEAVHVGRLYRKAPKPIAAYLLSTLYTLLLPAELRASQGIYFTPPPLVERLLDLVEKGGVDWREHSVLDPAAGGGAFVTPVAVRMARALSDEGASAAAVIDHIGSQLTGIELDAFSAWMSQVFLEIALWDYCLEAGTRLPNVVVQADALHHDFGPRRYDLIIGNPPYRRVTLPRDLRERYARSLYGHANLYGLFTDLAVQLCCPGGVIGYVTPASFLGGQYFKNLRALLASEAPPINIDFITDRSGVFDEVLQETVLISLGRGRAGRNVVVHAVRPFGAGAACEVSLSGSFPLPRDAHAPWLLPRTGDDVALLARLVDMPRRLRDYGLSVSTGPLVWNRHKPQLSALRGPNSYPLIWAESVLPSGKFEFSASRRNHCPFFNLYPGQEHLLTTEPVALVQRTTAKEQARRLVAALVPPEFIRLHRGLVIENHLNVVYRSSEASPVSLRAVVALLNSAVVDRIFRCISGSVAVSAFELAALPLPGPEIMLKLDALLERGAPEISIEKFLCDAYHTSPSEVAA